MSSTAGAQVPPAAESTAGQAATERIPFKGFEAYGENDAGYFFGRDREVKIVTSNLIASRLTLLHADSGVGKTSLLRAGVASKLFAEARVELAAGRKPRFLPVIFEAWKEDDPVAALMASMQASIEVLGLPKPVQDKGGQKADPEASLLVRALQAGIDYVDGSLLIVLDQFEQYFERHAGKDGGGPFARDFPDAVNHRHLRVNFLISIREEWLGKLDFFRSRIPRLFDNRLEIKRLDKTAARDAIVKPIDKYNLLWGSNVQPGEGLVEAVLKDVARGRIAGDLAGQGGAESRPGEENEYEAPYLQLVMRRLWEKEAELGSLLLRQETLNDVLGGAKAIVLQYVNSVMAALSQRQQRVAAVVFRYLVTPSGAKVAYSAGDLQDLAKSDESSLRLTEDADEYEVLLKKLVEKRILRSAEERHASGSSGGSEVRYEVFHDMLARPVLLWRASYRQEVQSKRRNLAPQAIAHLRHGECERAALLARQAYLFNKDVPEVLPQVDTALREVLSVNPFTYVWHRSSLFDFPMIAFSPDGKWLAGAGKDGYVYLWDVKRRLPPWSLRLHWERSEVCSVAFSNDGRVLATAGRDKTLKLVDLAALDGLPDATDREIPYKQLNPVVFDDPHAEGIIALAFRPGEKKVLASGSWDGFFRLWDVDAGRMLREWHGHDGWIWSVGFSPDGSRFASAGRDRVVRVWDPDRNDMFVAALGASDEVMSLAFAPDGEQLAAGGRDETVWIWSKGPGREWNQAEGRPIGKHSKPVRSVAFSPDGRILASASEDETVRLWDPHGAHGAPVLGELPHFYGVGSVAFRPLSERTLFSSCWDRTVRVWDIYPVEPRVLEGHRDSVQAVSFGADNSVASASWDKTVRLWDVKRPGVYRTFSGHGAEVYSVALYCSPDMKVQTLASGCLDGFVRLWDVTRDDAERSPAREFHHGGGVSAVAFGADGATLASGSHNGTIRLWDLAPGDGRPVEFRHSDRPVTCVAFGNHGKLLASGGDDADVKLWSFDPHGAPELIATLQGHDSRVWSVGISPDGRYLASGGDDRTVQLWQIDDPSKLVSNNPVRTLSGHEFWVGSVAFSPDGRFLAAGGYDRTIRLWDLLKLFDPDEFNDDPLVLRGHQQSVTSVAFSPRGRFLVSGSTDNTVRIWTLELEELANRVCSKVSRNLSREEWEKSIGLGVRYQCTCPDLPRGEGVLQDA